MRQREIGGGEEEESEGEDDEVVPAPPWLTNASLSPSPPYRGTVEKKRRITIATVTPFSLCIYNGARAHAMHTRNAHHHRHLTKRDVYTFVRIDTTQQTHTRTDQLIYNYYHYFIVISLPSSSSSLSSLSELAYIDETSLPRHT